MVIFHGYDTTKREGNYSTCRCGKVPVSGGGWEGEVLPAAPRADVLGALDPSGTLQAPDRDHMAFSSCYGLELN